MKTNQTCPSGTDNVFGPRVNQQCRSFDFTLLFEDSLFITLPAALFLLMLPPRLHLLRHASVKLSSMKLAMVKLGMMLALFILQLLYTGLQAKSAALHTNASITSNVVNLLAIMAGAYVSFMEDQRSVAPSDLLIIYLSANSLLSLPRLRTLWLIHDTSVTAPRITWTIFVGFTVAATLVESITKTKFYQEQYRRTTKEESSSFWLRSLFTWLLPLLRLGFTNLLSNEDMPEVDEDLKAHPARQKLELSWQVTQGNYRLTKAVIKAYFWPLIFAVLPRIALTAFTFAQPFLITAAIKYVESPTSSKGYDVGPALVGAFVLVYVGMALSKAVYWRQAYRFHTMLRAGLISMIYNKTLALKEDDVSDSAAITLMGTDVERIVVSLRMVHELWAALLEVGIALWLLQSQIWIACVVPLVICIGCVVGMIPVSRYSGLAQKSWVERVETRLSITSKTLKDIKAFKMLGLIDILESIVHNLRYLEVATSVRFRKLFVWQILLSNTPINFAPFATFAVYTLISLTKHDRTFLSAQAFTSLALISLLTIPLLMFCQAMPAMLQVIACFGRIQEYCELQSNGPVVAIRDRDSQLLPSTDSDWELPEYPNDGCVAGEKIFVFENASVSKGRESASILKQINLSIFPGITAITGPTGSGKSTLLDTMIGKTVIDSGSISSVLQKCAYCSQTPWIQNNTIRKNITGHLPFEQTWYDFVISACGLERDLKTLSSGDLHCTGSNGEAISGGQKQRTALARAVYSRSRILLLDDVFSGLDSKSAALIIQRLFSRNGHFQQAGRSVVVVTNSPYLLPHVDNIVLLEQGRVVDVGSYPDIMTRHVHLNLEASSPSQKRSEMPETAQNDSTTVIATTKNSMEALVSDGADKKDKVRRDGSWSVYSYYFRNAGILPITLVLVGVIIEAFPTAFSTLWLQWWVESEQSSHPQTGKYLGVYGLLFLVSLTGLTFGCLILFVTVLNNTSLSFHSNLLNATINAPVSFFQRTNLGSIINRFGQDLELIDMMLPTYFINFVVGMATCFMQLIILCIVAKYLAASVPVVGLLLYLIQSFYLRTSRQVRLLDIEAKAPLYAHFLETIQGISTVRAFGWQSEFESQNQELLNQSQKPVYMLFSIQQWLTLTLDLIVGAVAIILIAIVTGWKETLKATSIGVALNLLLTFNLSLTQVIKYWTMTEISVGAIARIQSFVNETPKEENGEEKHDAPPLWPGKGDICFRNVTAAYNVTSPSILKNINLKIQPKEKVAICGPSGSGKSSLIMTLLRMLDTTAGDITIDRLNIDNVQCKKLRERINVLPQDPVFMPGSVRFNLDPRGNAEDSQIESVLEQVGLWKRISDKAGLDTELDPNDWSVGQRQLLALARALLVNSSILILDEATSSVDVETETLMQDIIETHFKHQTVIAIVHRFRFIDRYDRVILLKQGEIIEDGIPEVLLSKDSEFRRLHRALESSG